jgi:3-oxoacyl-[acyl-carrier protein] reductase
MMFFQSVKAHINTKEEWILKLKDKVAIVTGSTSGMGRATAVLFAREGAKVVVAGRNEKRAKEVVDQIKNEGLEAIYVLADMSKPEDSKVLVDKALEAYGTVDILFNNAGMLSMSPLQELKMEEWDRVMNVNVTSVLYLTQLVAPIMKKKGKGVIINTSSVAGFAAHHGFAAYVTTKHALVGLTKSMAWELGPEIRVNAIAPGAIHTAMVDSIGGVEAVKDLIEGSPLKRIGQPEDIASVALFLACDDSSFITGQVLRVDGGIDI